MSIRFRCEDCQAKIKVPQGAEGRKVKCPRCGAVHRVPQHAAVLQHDAQGVGEESDIDLDSLASAVGNLAAEDQPVGDSVDEPSPSALAQASGLSDRPMIDEPQDDEEDDPLAVLASVAEGAEEEQDSEEDISSFDPDPSLEDEKDEAPEEIDDLFDDPHPQPETRPQPAFPSAITSTAIKPTIPLATPKPRPKPASAMDDDAAIDSQPIPHVRPGSPVLQPRVVGLSSRLAGHRPQPKPIPLADPSAAEVSASVGPPPAVQIMLSVIGWVLRAMGVLAILGAVILTVAPDDSWTIGARLLVLLYGLIVAVVVWALGEIALAVRYLVQRRG